MNQRNRNLDRTHFVQNIDEVDEYMSLNMNKHTSIKVMLLNLNLTGNFAEAKTSILN